jgi:hypothetical protein
MPSGGVDECGRSGIKGPGSQNQHGKYLCWRFGSLTSTICLNMFSTVPAYVTCGGMRQVLACGSTRCCHSIGVVSLTLRIGRSRLSTAHLAPQVQHRRDATGRAISTETWRSLDPSLPAALLLCDKDAAGRLISRAVCGCALTPAPLRVCAALLTPSGRDLLVAAQLVLPSDEEAAPWRVISVHVRSLHRWAPLHPACWIGAAAAMPLGETCTARFPTMALMLWRVSVLSDVCARLQLCGHQQCQQCVAVHAWQ